MATEIPDTYSQQIHQQVLDAFGLDDDTDFNFDGYLAARAAADAEYEEFRAELPTRLATAVREAGNLLRAYGVTVAPFEFICVEDGAR